MNKLIYQMIATGVNSHGNLSHIESDFFETEELANANKEDFLDRCMDDSNIQYLYHDPTPIISTITKILVYESGNIL